MFICFYICLEHFPDKGNQIELREKYRLLTEPKNKLTSDCPPNIDNVNELIVSTATREQTLHSFHTLFCRRCYKYDCLIHKYKQPLPTNISSNNITGNLLRKLDFSKVTDKPCSNDCYKLKLLNEYSKMINIANKGETIKNDSIKANHASNSTVSNTTPTKNNNSHKTNATTKRTSYEINQSNKSLLNNSQSGNFEKEENFLNKLFDTNLVNFDGVEETLYKVYNKIFQYNSCVLSKILHGKNCFQIWIYVCKLEFDFGNNQTNQNNPIKQKYMNDLCLFINQNINNFNSSSNNFNSTEFNFKILTSPIKNISLDASINNKLQLSLGLNNKRNKKAKKPKVKHSHFLARKLHEEAAHSLNNTSNNNFSNNMNGTKYDGSSNSNHMNNSSSYGNGNSSNQLSSTNDNNNYADNENEQSSPLLRVHSYHPCDHPGLLCNENCKCVRNGNFCEKFCQCSIDCINRFRGCKCRSQCNSKHCPCYLAVRECDPDLCQTCGANNFKSNAPPTGCCVNVAIQRGLRKHLLLAPSEVAGWGIFLKERVNKNEFIAEYCGEVITQDEADRRGKVYDKHKCSFLFNLNNDFVVDATRKGNKIRFANHSVNPNCYAKVMLVNGDHRIGIFAKHDIEAGEELFFDYRYGPTEQLKFVGIERSIQNII